MPTTDVMARQPASEAAPRPVHESAPPLTYRAFLSYSHRDRAAAERLHRWLETFRLPVGLVGKPGAGGPVPARLHPVFRDRHELAASSDLGAVIRDALAASGTLLVLCSPDAAQSRWVDEEIRTFRRLRPHAPVLAALLSGEPGESFPPALRDMEPVAADFRPDGDGERLARLKLAAGIAGVPLDALVRRDAARRQTRLAWLAAASLAGMGVTSGLAIAAVQARDEAERQRAEAEGLVGFMLTDLRGRVEPLGRLDVLDAVGARALSYYARQDREMLTDEGLAQRSRALTLIGEIANLRGDLPGALRRYREALAGTAVALARAPDDPQRIFDHAQNVFWVGYIAWQRGQAAPAEARFREYKALADRLVALEPGKADWRLERVYADTNLGMLLLEERDFARAAAAFEGALREAEGLAAAHPAERRYAESVGQSLAYLGDAQRRGGQLDAALASRERQLDVLERLATRGGDGADVQRQATVARQAIAGVLLDRGEVETALGHLRLALSGADALRRLEPDNTEWLEAGAGVQADGAEMLLAAGRAAEAGPLLRASCENNRRLRARDASVERWRISGLVRCLRLQAELALHERRPFQALADARSASALLGPTPGADDASRGAAVLLIAGDALAAAGREQEALAEWRRALARLPARMAPSDHALRVRLLRRLGGRAEAEALAARLLSRGYAHPALREGGRVGTG